ncbi:hypothetical protein [Vibrio campbellii]|uniref:hypothetical protein n=1 Tax=Vibrio campbellii TaxID=680 RepID=UPI000CD37119|nr:hypothetical protein [Vibrio campbellii]AUW07409.1 hypothetical protein C1N51_27525 [Vibrio campbellii]
MSVEMLDGELLDLISGGAFVFKSESSTIARIRDALEEIQVFFETATVKNCIIVVKPISYDDLNEEGFMTIYRKLSDRLMSVEPMFYAKR